VFTISYVNFTIMGQWHASMNLINVKQLVCQKGTVSCFA